MNKLKYIGEIIVFFITIWPQIPEEQRTNIVNLIIYFYKSFNEYYDSQKANSF
jgi:hypothetical protein